MNKIKFYLTNRFILFILIVGIFLVVTFLFTGNFFPTTETKDIWFYSGLFMVLFSVLFIEPFYSSPKNVITNSIPLLLVYLAIQKSFKSNILWWISIGTILFLILISIFAMALFQENVSSETTRNKISEKLKSFAVIFGQGKVIYSAVFLSVLFLYQVELIRTIPDTYYYTMVILWGCLLLINTKAIHSSFSPIVRDKQTNAIGEIFSVQSEKMFLVKLFEDKKNVKKFDLVKFRYKMDSSFDCINNGFIFDTYNLNNQKWAKVLLLHIDKENCKKLKSNTLYKIDDKEKISLLTKDLCIESFVGVIIEGTKIGNIKFEYSKKINDLQEGDLLELEVDGTKIFYQVFGGITNSEKLELKDESGFIEGEAIQLGTWNDTNLSFEKYGWLPQINTPIFRANTENINVPDFNFPEYKLGVIPSTNLPSIINLNYAVSHHLALLGVTGSGKSFIARELIKELSIDTKIIIIDFTGEWKEKLQELSPVDIINTDKLPVMEKLIAEKETESSNRNSDKSKILEFKRKIQEQLFNYFKDFMESNNKVALFEIPELSNTTFILEFTQLFIESIFSYAKTKRGSKICLVLEEAHTIVPETGFLGDLGDYGSSKALVSKMSQIALQGRKFGVGLIVIAQRTANVSKTVLTQCNTIICFQAFDETSFAFLGNYIGKDLTQALPNLKLYHAIVTGKAIKSNIPMIVNLERKTHAPNN
ncbi:MAG: hypothetical protein A2X64_00075 [Ignavibacteria bacterium GWF2_33_9]|nr:MAG: hypothetical protein A2X64_00075 [Ignavibacteria bacterium GWF2_33_9]